MDHNDIIKQLEDKSELKFVKIHVELKLKEK